MDAARTAPDFAHMATHGMDGVSLDDERMRLVERIDTLDRSWLHARDAGATAAHISELRDRLAELDAARNAKSGQA
jgi:hypothetical protein